MWYSGENWNIAQRVAEVFSSADACEGDVGAAVKDRSRNE